MELYLDILLFTPYVTSLLLCLVSLYFLAGRKEVNLFSNLSIDNDVVNKHVTQHYFVISKFIYLNILKKIPVKEKDEEDAIPSAVV